MSMNRLLNHHSGGGYEPSAADIDAYHRLISFDGTVHDGRHAIAANAPGPHWSRADMPRIPAL